MPDIRCDDCGIGRYRLISSPYVLPLGRHMLVMPDAPAYICDVCGYRCFDDDFLIGVHYLVRQTVNDSQQRAKRRQRPQADAPVSPGARRGS